MKELAGLRIVKRFGGVTAVDDVSIRASLGKITALIGPNGAGKTTLFNILSGFDEPDAGEVLLDGKRIDRRPPWRIARMGLARTFQTPTGFPEMTVWQNLLVAGGDPIHESIPAGILGPRLWAANERSLEARGESILDRLSLQSRRDSLSMDLTAGEQKLVELSRQLMRSPATLLLDEPAAGVDASSIPRLAAAIREFNQDGMTVLIIDHNLGFIMDIADHVYVLAEGKVLAAGPPVAVAADAKVIEAYLGRPSESAQR